MIKHPDNSEEERFLSRWSRKKQQGQEAESNESPAQNPTDVVDEPEEQREQIPLNTVIPPAQTGTMSTMVEADRLLSAQPVQPPQELTDDDMPAIESLNESSDYTGFLSQGVSRQLRKAAMRKLFSAAGFNVRDGLDDYDDDFTNFEPLGDIVTSDMKHQQEMAEKRKREKEEAERLAAEQDQSGDTEPGADDNTDEVADIDNADEHSDQLAASEADSLEEQKGQSLSDQSNTNKKSNEESMKRNQADGNTPDVSGANEEPTIV